MFQTMRRVKTDDYDAYNVRRSKNIECALQAHDGYFYEKVRQMRPRSLLSVYLVSLAYKALPILIRLQWDG